MYIYKYQFATVQPFNTIPNLYATKSTITLEYLLWYCVMHSFLPFLITPKEYNISWNRLTSFFRSMQYGKSQNPKKKYNYIVLHKRKGDSVNTHWQKHWRIKSWRSWSLAYWCTCVTFGANLSNVWFSKIVRVYSNVQTLPI